MERLFERSKEKIRPNCLVLLLYFSTKICEATKAGNARKTLLAKGDKTLGTESQKHLFEGGQKGVFGLYSALQNLNQKIRQNDGKIEDFSEMVSIYRLAKTHFTTKA